MWQESDTKRLLRDISGLGWTLLRRFSAVYEPEDVIAALTGLARDDFEQLRRLHYLRSSRVLDFVFRTCPTFLRSMPQATELAVREDRSYPRGMVDWIRTLSLRTRSGGDESLFVSRSPQRSRNTPAARLFAWLLNDIAQSCVSALDGIAPEVARAALLELGGASRRHLAALAARGILPPASARASDFAGLRRSTRAEIRQALDLLHARKALFASGGEQRLLEIMSSGMFAPENLDDLYECWTLLQLVELHLRAGWVITSARLVGGSRRRFPSFELNRSGDTVHLFYQMVPPILSGSSYYKDLFEDYDLDVSLRRPDIVAHVSTKTYSGPMIVEVKRTSDRTYIADSAYKVLGYLADYRSHFGEGRPKSILVVYDGIIAPEIYSASAEIWIVTGSKLKTLQLPY